MAADASIFQQYLRPPKSVAEYGAEMDTREANQLELAAKRQGVTDDAAMRKAYAESAGDQNKLLQALRASGNYRGAQAVEKSLLETQKTQGEIDKAKAQTGQFGAATEKTKEETRYLQATHHAQGLANVNDINGVARYAEEGIAKGIFPPGVRDAMVLEAQKFPNVQAWRQHMEQGAIPILDKYKTAAENARAAAANETRIKTTGMTVAQSERASLRADARGREATAATVGRPFEVTGPDGNLILVQQDKKGNITPVQGYGPKAAVEKPLNEGQSKALLFGERMRQADTVLDQLATEGTTRSVPGSRAPVVGGVISALSSGNQQMLDQAKRNFMTAVLRRESGASISSGEFATADQQYFPQIGDSAKVIAQKKANRELAINGVLSEVPAKQRESLRPKNPAAGDASSARSAADKILGL